MLSNLGITFLSIALLSSFFLIYFSFVELKFPNNKIPKKIFKFSFVQMILTLLSFFTLMVGYIFSDFSYYFNKKYENKLIKNNDDLSMFLLEEAEVATVSGSAFGDQNCIRISIASSQNDLTEAIYRIQKYLSKLS